MAESTATPKTETAPVVPVDPKVATERGDKLYDAINRKVVHDLTNGQAKNINGYALMPLHGLMSMGADKASAEKFNDEMDAAREGTIYAFGRAEMSPDEQKHVVDFLATQELMSVRLYGVACATAIEMKGDNK